MNSDTGNKYDTHREVIISSHFDGKTNRPYIKVRGCRSIDSDSTGRHLGEVLIGCAERCELRADKLAGTAGDSTGHAGSKECGQRANLCKAAVAGWGGRKNSNYDGILQAGCVWHFKELELKVPPSPPPRIHTTLG